MSNTSSEQASAIKYFSYETIGSIEISYAYRFYEMENKESDEETYYLVRVCQFYLEWCKQQKLKSKYSSNI